MRRSLPFLPLAVVLLLGLAAVAQPGAAPAERTREAEMREIARGLACPVCEGLSVADSPSPLATQMREAILRRLEAGETRDQVVGYFVERYGEGILFEPPKRSFGLLIWWVPVLALLVGGAVLGVALARWVRRPPPARRVAPEDWAAYGPVLEADLARREGRQAP